jgi:hypothetical protein
LPIVVGQIFQRRGKRQKDFSLRRDSTGSAHPRGNSTLQNAGGVLKLQGQGLFHAGIAPPSTEETADVIGHQASENSPQPRCELFLGRSAKPWKMPVGL